MLKGRGTVATGRVEQGTIKVGEEVEVLGLAQVNQCTTYILKLCFVWWAWACTPCALRSQQLARDDFHLWAGYCVLAL